MSSKSLVSIIIPCFKQECYLSDAIQSVLAQTYQNFELIVIDDGSTDNARDICNKSNNVKYFYQENQGLATARNTDIFNCSGEYLVFLDADDNALECNIKPLKEDPQIAFVSGFFEWTDINRQKLGEKKECISQDHYLSLLRSNYISMNAMVMYRRFVFEDLLFDSTLNACKDYDMYLLLNAAKRFF